MYYLILIDLHFLRYHLNLKNQKYLNLCFDHLLKLHLKYLMYLKIHLYLILY